MSGFNVTQAELRSYLQNKIIKLEAELAATRKAYELIDEAANEIALNKLSGAGINPESSVDNHHITENGKKFAMDLCDAVEQLSSNNSDNVIKPEPPTAKQSVEQFKQNQKNHLQQGLEPQSMLVDDFLKSLRSLRKSSGFTTNQIVSDLEISDAGLYFIEGGQTKGRKATIQGLANVFKVTLIDIDKKYGDNPNGRYQSEHVAQQKSLKAVKGKIQKQIDNTTTSGQKISTVKRRYTKRETKSEPVAEEG